MGYKKPTMIFFDYRFRFEVCSIYEFYEFGLKAHKRRARELKRGEPSSEEYRIDESVIIDDLGRQLGYAVTILLYSAVEDALLRASRYLGIKNKDKLSKQYPRKSVLAAAAELFMDKFKLNFKAIASVPHQIELLPDGLDLNIGILDLGLLDNFVWARNRIVHDRGLAEVAEAKKRNIPLDGNLLDDDTAEEDKIRAKIGISKEYIDQVTQHLIVFVDCLAQELRSRGGHVRSNLSNATP